VLIAFVLEGSILALAGGVLGCALSLLMNGIRASSTGSMGEISFAFRATAIDLVYGLLFAVTIGIIGSFLPAWDAARMPIISALREE